MSTTRLPVLFLTDLVVLPGMVVPIELDEAARAAVDAARSHSDSTLLVAPRLEDRYAAYGVEASIVQIGRLQSGESAAVIKAESRVKIGSGVSGPGTALWVEAEELPRPGRTPRGPQARCRVQVTGHRHPAAARRLAGDRHRQQGDRPVDAGRPGRLAPCLPTTRSESSGDPDVAARLTR